MLVSALFVLFDNIRVKIMNVLSCSCFVKILILVVDIIHRLQCYIYYKFTQLKCGSKLWEIIEVKIS